MDRQQLTENIEMLRRQLHVVGKIHGMSSDAAVSLSQQLDQHIDAYYFLTYPDPELSQQVVNMDEKNSAKG